MPRTDRTGPKAMRAMTGRGTGNCVGGQGRGEIKSGSGAGVGGRGLCGWFDASELAEHSPQENEENMLRGQAAALKRQQEEIQRRLKKLGK